MRRFVLTLSCPDRMGIVAAVSTFLLQQRCNIVDSAQFGDAVNGRFFMRVKISGTKISGTKISKNIGDRPRF